MRQFFVFRSTRCRLSFGFVARTGKLIREMTKLFDFIFFWISCFLLILYLFCRHSNLFLLLLFLRLNQNRSPTRFSPSLFDNFLCHFAVHFDRVNTVSVLLLIYSGAFLIFSFYEMILLSPTRPIDHSKPNELEFLVLFWCCTRKFCVAFFFFNSIKFKRNALSALLFCIELFSFALWWHRNDGRIPRIDCILVNRHKSVNKH